MGSLYLERLIDLQSFVKAQAGETSLKFLKLKDEQAQKGHLLKRFQKIREKIDLLTEDLVSQPALGKNQSQDQQLQLAQVKWMLTSFLKSAGQQMKTSQEELNSVIKIINLDQDIIPQSTNSLIIKLWNTILTSVAEFKKTAFSNQSEVSKKLDVMDCKLDTIMDKIEDGKNEVLLELYRMSKVQDILLDQTNEQLISKAKKILFDTYKLSQANIQLSQFTINKIPSSQYLNSLLLEHLSFSNTEIMKPRLQKEEAKTQNVMTQTNEAKQWQLNKNPLLVNHFNTKEAYNFTIILCSNGNIVVGGKDKKLYQYSSDFQQLQVKEINDLLLNGMAIGEHLYCTIANQLAILDQNTLDTLKTISLKFNVLKMLLVDDHLILGQLYGGLEIVSISQQSTIYQTQLKNDTITDIVKINESNEYAFAQIKGLFFKTIINMNNQITLVENIEDNYFKDKFILCVQNTSQNLLIVAVKYSAHLHLMNIQTKEIIKRFGVVDGRVNVITRLLGYDETTFPYLIVKDQNNLAIVDTNTFEMISTTPLKLELYTWKSTLSQKYVEDKLYLFACTDNYNKEKGIQQIEIANFQ